MLDKDLSGSRDSEQVLCTSRKRKGGTVTRGGSVQEKDITEKLSKSAIKKQEKLKKGDGGQARGIPRQNICACNFKQAQVAFRHNITVSSDFVTHRDLLLSTRDISKKSKRDCLKKTLKKHRAGLPLNESDSTCLLKKRKSTGDCPSFSEDCPAQLSAPCKRECKSHNYSHSSIPKLLQQFEDIKQNFSKGQHQASEQDEETEANICSNILKSSPQNITPLAKDTNDAIGSFEQTPLPIDEWGKIISTKPDTFERENIVAHGSIHLKRDDSIQESRSQLPIYRMEQEIVEAVKENDVVILCGETGSGKSTQIPQFLYENGFCSAGMIAITQPRRVAVTTTARRVSIEMGCSLDDCDCFPGGSLVGFQIRHDSSTMSPGVRIKFMTDGILLKEVTSDILMKKYSVIVLDEAHERNVNTDVLLGILSRTITLRKKLHEEESALWYSITENERSMYKEPIKPLRVVIMSATLRVDDFLSNSLFETIPPVIRVESRQFVVKTHFSKRTNTTDYLEESFSKVCQIHRKLPPGGILLFLTGKKEILHMCERLNLELNCELKQYELDDDANHENLLDNEEREDFADEYLVEESVLSSSVITPDSLADKDALSERDAAEEFNECSTRSACLAEVLPAQTKANEVGTSKLTNAFRPHSMEENDRHSLQLSAHVLPLYALLSSERQKRVFEDPPEGYRLIVVATNVAETSITIPGIRYVVDCGRQKERILDPKSGVSSYKVTWVSKASADQRKGRAGRTGPGHCYRLYSSAFYNKHMKDFQDPEIYSVPLEDLVLQLRSMGIRSVENFPFPTKPQASSILQAQTLLLHLGALRPLPSRSTGSSTSSMDKINMLLESKNSKALDGGITELGRHMSKFPVNSRFSKILIVANSSGSIPLSLCVAMVVCLTEKSMQDDTASKRGSIKCRVSQDEESAATSDKRPPSLLSSHPTSDILARLREFGAFFYFVKTSRTYDDSRRRRREDNADVASFCEGRNLHHPTMLRSLKLFYQLEHICSLCLDYSSKFSSNGSNYLIPPTEIEEIALRQILLTGFPDSIARKASGSAVQDASSKRKRLTSYLSCNPNVNVPLLIHPQSSLYQKDPEAPLPEYVVYSELVESEDGETTFMSGVTQISPNWIAELTGDSPLLQWSPPLQFPLPYYDKENDCLKCFVSAEYGVHKWELPVQECEMLAACRRSNTKEDEAYRWFCTFLLEGKVTSQNADLRNVFCKSNLVDTPERKMVEKVNSLVIYMSSQCLCSLSAMKAHARINKNELYARLLPFFTESAKIVLKKSWKSFLRN